MTHPVTPEIHAEGARGVRSDWLVRGLDGTVGSEAKVTLRARAHTLLLSSSPPPLLLLPLHSSLHVVAREGRVKEGDRVSFVRARTRCVVERNLAPLPSLFCSVFVPPPLLLLFFFLYSFSPLHSSLRSFERRQGEGRRPCAARAGSFVAGGLAHASAWWSATCGRSAGKPTLPTPPFPLVCSAFFVPLFFFFFFFFVFIVFFLFLFFFFLSPPLLSLRGRLRGGKVKEKDRVQRVQARLWLEASHTLQRGGVQLGGRKAGKPTLLPPPSPLLSPSLSLSLSPLNSTHQSRFRRPQRPALVHRCNPCGTQALI